MLILNDHESRNVCLRIKAELKKFGLKCWIDIEDLLAIKFKS